MKIILIRHGRVNMQWKLRYDSEGFDQALREYEESDVQIGPEEALDTKGRPVYVSTSKRSRETAGKLFGETELTETPLLDEVPLRSFRDTSGEHFRWVWNAAGRIQWYLGNRRQAETRQESRERAGKLAAMLQKKGEDCIVISHGWFLTVLLGELKRNGYEVKRGSLVRIAPLERIMVTEKAPHCGNCLHNCLLTDPGCDVGRGKAIAKGIK